MPDTSLIPYFRSFILGKSVPLDALSDLSTKELQMLDVETLASLEEARRNHESIEDKQSEEASAAYRRMKVAGYFQAAIRIARSEQ